MLKPVFGSVAPQIRGLTEFFQTAFRRDLSERFDNAEEMLRAWRGCFEGIEQPGTFSDHDSEDELRQLLAEATFDTQIPELRLGTRAINALDRANILTVEDLLTIPLKRLMAMPGVGNRTRREIALAVRILRERLGQPQAEGTLDIEKTETPSEQMDVANLSVDLVAPRVIRPGAKDDDTARQTLQALLGLDPSLNDPWPSQSDVARLCQITRARVGQLVGKFLSRWTKDAAITRLRESIAEILERAGGVMTVVEVVEAVLVARGSIQDEPQRTQLATAVVRASVEVERMIVNPRFLVRRDHNRVFVALTQELASYANRLGDEADTLADEDPLVPPARVVQRLRHIQAPSGIIPLSDSRLIRLAAAASQHAAVSSRQELYPRGMEAIRALKLSQGALYGVRSLTIEQIRERVSSRYPEAAALPNRPLLDELLRETGFDFQWDAVAEAVGCYVSRLQLSVSVPSGSASLSRMPTIVGPVKDEEGTPEIADARQFEERLQRGIKDGSFLALLVNPKCYRRACKELCRRFPIQLVDFEALFLDTLQQVAEKANVNWDLVLKTDAAPHTGDWDKLMLLVGRTMPLVEQQLVQADKTMLMVYAGLLARYDQMTVLERLRDKVGRREGIPGLWLLVPNDQQAVIDGKAVPIISAGQRARIPESWLKNIHRASGNGAILT